MLVTNHACEKALPGVRGAHSARTLITVESQCPGGEIIAPEGVLEIFSQEFGAAFEDRRLFGAAQDPGQRSPASPCAPGICLRFANRDGTGCERTVCMKDCVIGIFPALMDKTVVRAAAVFEESIPITIAVFFHPQERRLDIWPDLLDELPIARSLE